MAMCFSRVLSCFVFVFTRNLKINADVSPTTNLDCEIRADCYKPHVCQYTRPMTVVPDSNVTLNCSVKDGKVPQGANWRDLNKMVNAHQGLVLQQMNSTSGNHSCRCTPVKFTRAVQILLQTGSPVSFYQNERLELKCSFKGWPRPRVVWYNPVGKQITNGSEGFYLSEELKGDDALSSVLQLHNIQEKHKGVYWCLGENNSSSSWSSKLSAATFLIYQCPWPTHPTIDSPQLSAVISSNITLKCLIEIDPDACVDSLELQWRFNGSSTPLKASEKYKFQQKETESRCKIEFILFVVNITEADEGKYSCHSVCEIAHLFSAIELKVFPPTKAATTSSPNDTDNNVEYLTGAANSRHKNWIWRIITLPSGVVIGLIVLAV